MISASKGPHRNLAPVHQGSKDQQVIHAHPEYDREKRASLKHFIPSICHRQTPV